jgi:hypothetical protein
MVDSKKFKKQGIMAQENEKTREVVDNQATEKQKNQKITDMEKEVLALEK